MRARLLLVFALSWAVFAFGCGGSSQHARIRAGDMPPGGSFTGVWFSPQYGEMHMQQNGATVIGRYAKDEKTGRVQGSVEGDIMRFEWTQSRELIVGRPTVTKGHGYFRLVKDTTEDTWKLVGEWGNDDDERGGGPWNAVRSKNRRPDVSGDGGADSSASADSGSEASDDSSGGESEGGDDLGDL